jgi:hypothetical protein
MPEEHFKQRCCCWCLQVITKGKLPKLPAELESGSILELGNFVAEYDKEITLDDFK